MSMPSVVFEVLVRSVRLEVDALQSRAGRHLLNATLVWPRPLIAARTALQPLTLKAGICARAEEPWHARVLFKERVQGRFALVLSLSEAVPDAAMDALIRAVASQTLRGAAADAAQAATAGGSLLSGLWTAPFAVLAREVARQAEPAAIGIGALESDSGALDPKNAVLHEIPLVAPRDLTRVARQADGERTRRLSRTLAAAGERIGCVEVEVLPAG